MTTGPERFRNTGALRVFSDSETPLEQVKTAMTQKLGEESMADMDVDFIPSRVAGYGEYVFVTTTFDRSPMRKHLKNLGFQANRIPIDHIKTGIKDKNSWYF